MLDIIKGKQAGPIKAVVYGPEGIGKSTFAAAWPRPLFVDAEDGTSRLEVDRVRPQSWSAVEGGVAELTKDAAGYKTLVLDTADWAEKLLTESVCAAAGMKGIESFGYGKGFTHLAEAWKKFLDQLGRMQRAQGIHVLFLAHSTMRKFEQPDEAGAYDRWEMKLSKTSNPLLKEWADLVLFLNYKTLVVEIDGKKKAQGGRRVMYAEHHTCWDAKNRFGLPAEMPLEIAAVSSLFVYQPTPAPQKKPAAPSTTSAPAPAKQEPASAPAPVDDPEKVRLLSQLADLMKQTGTTKDQLAAELARKGVCPPNMSPREYNVATLKRVVAGWAAITKNIAALQK